MISRPWRIAALSVAGSLLFAASPFAQTSELSGLHDALRLSAAQEPAWRAYVAAITPDPAAESRHQSAAAMMANLPTPRRVDLIDAEMQADLTAVRRQGAAVKTFYETLSPTQKQTFDRQTLQRPEPEGNGALRQPSDGRMPPPSSYR